MSGPNVAPIPSGGDQFEQYEIIRGLGSGGAGAVFLARLRDTPYNILKAEVCALKLLGDEALHLEDRFINEGRLCYSLNHPHIIRVHRAAIHQGRLFLEMDYVDGCDLKRLQEGLRAPMPPQVAWQIVADLADALHYAHFEAKGTNGRGLRIVHRDIKPANILLSRFGDVKLTDLGIAKTTINEDETLHGDRMGTPRYFSPEHLEGGDKVDHRSDLFCLALVAEELLTGARVARGEAPRLPADLPQGERGLAILRRARAQGRAQRYQSGRELRRDILELLACLEPMDVPAWIGAQVDRLCPLDDERTMLPAEDGSLGSIRSSGHLRAMAPGAPDQEPTEQGGGARSGGASLGVGWAREPQTGGPEEGIVAGGSAMLPPPPDPTASGVPARSAGVRRPSQIVRTMGGVGVLALLFLLMQQCSGCPPEEGEMTGDVTPSVTAGPRASVGAGSISITTAVTPRSQSPSPSPSEPKPTTPTPTPTPPPPFRIVSRQRDLPAGAGGIKLQFLNTDNVRLRIVNGKPLMYGSHDYLSVTDPAKGVEIEVNGVWKSVTVKAGSTTVCDDQDTKLPCVMQ